MVAMREVHLRNVDLNLLSLLQPLLEERNVTRAARRSFLSQSAMSRALDRLRETVGDPLLVRTGRTYERTPRGERLLREMESITRQLKGIIQDEEFDPAQTRELFRMAMTDHGSIVLMPPLMERVRTAAPNVRVEESAWNDRVYEDLAAGRIDIALSAEPPPSGLQSEILYKEDCVCLVGRAQRIRNRRFTLKQYLKLPHVVVETWAGQQTQVDRPLAELGLKRNAVFRVPFFVPTIFTIARTDLVLTVPRRLGKIAAGATGLRMVEPPRELKRFTYSMAWHPRLTTEPAHAWFRDQLRMVARGIRTK
jgi:DNA-binding transcriptional LysR family regulator